MSGQALGGKRATREEIEAAVKVLNDIGFSEICEKYEICGSYRRGKPDSGDVDIVFIPKDIKKYEEWFEGLNLEKRKGFLSNNILINEIQIDLFLSSAVSYPTYLMMWTGSRGFNIRMRGISLSKGYIYTRNGMIHLKTGEVVKEINNEKDIFDLLDIKYIPPEER